MMQIQIALS